MQLLILAVCASVAVALPQYGNYYQQQPQAQYKSKDANAQILRSSADVTDTGYNFGYETDNGIQAQEQGQEADGINASGQFSYTGDDNQVYSISYRADANGFQPQGAHIPTPHPIPAEIQEGLEKNARDEAAGIFDDGSYQPGKYESGSPQAPARAFPAAPARAFSQSAFSQASFKSKPRYF